MNTIKLIYEIFQAYGLSFAFLNLTACLKIALTLPISRASNQRAFSKLKLVKSCIPSTMLKKLLYDLLMISSKKDIKLDYNKIIDKYCEKSFLLKKKPLYEISF